MKCRIVNDQVSGMLLVRFTSTDKSTGKQKKLGLLNPDKKDYLTEKSM